MFRERNETYMLLFAAFDLFTALLAFWSGFFFRFFIQNPEFTRLENINIAGYFFIGLFIAVSLIIVFYFMEMYRPGKIGLLTNELGSVITGTILTIFIAMGLIFFLRTHRYSRLVILYFGILNITYITISRTVIRAVINRIHRKGKHLREMIVIGTGKTASQIEGVIKKNQLYGYHVSGFIRLPEETDSIVENTKIIGQLEDLPRILSEKTPYHVVYASDSGSRETLLHAITSCTHEGIHLFLVPIFSELLTAKIHFESIDGISFIGLRDIPARRGLNRLLKRVFDSLFSFLFIILFSPFYILIALAVKLTSRGPVFFRQERVGLNNKTFMLLKYRTMYIQKAKDSDTIWTTKKDPRVTPVGRVLRKLSLDEFPQFFNVLTGKMSVVGPRPERPFWVEQYKEKYMGYMQRHGMKAGITGWAQINGLRGDTSIEKRVAADIYYIENWSFLLDLKIIILTPIKSLIDRNAY